MDAAKRTRVSFRRVVFPIRLNKAMELRNITPNDLADAAGLERETVAEYLSMSRFPTKAAIAKLVMILGTSEEWLLGKDDTVKFSKPADAARYNAMLAYWTERIDAHIRSLQYESCQAQAVLGARMQAALKKKRMSQTELVHKLSDAGYTNLKRSTIGTYCQGKTLPPTELLLHISAVLEKHPLWLLGGEEEAWPGDGAVFNAPAESTQPTMEQLTQEALNKAECAQINNILTAIGSVRGHRLMLVCHEDDELINAFHSVGQRERTVIRSILRLPAIKEAQANTEPKAQRAATDTNQNSMGQYRTKLPF